jgi:3-oxoacyl-[acyl-carrier protein] reductase
MPDARGECFTESRWYCGSLMRCIRGRKAIVTGAASGIGRAIALALAAEGADLFLIDRDATLLALTVAEAMKHGSETKSAVCDLAVVTEITAVVAEIQAVWSEIHILINCAGVASYGPFHLTDDETWHRIMAVNLLAPMHLIHAFLPNLFAAEEAHILNVCSIAGLVPAKRASAYQASKYGLVGFTLALRNDYQRDSFGITALCPGFVRTPMLTGLRDPEAYKEIPLLPNLISTSPEVVANRAISAIRHGKGLVIVTPFAKLVWWVARAFPSLLDWINREGWRQRGKPY